MDEPRRSRFTSTAAAKAVAVFVAVGVLVFGAKAIAGDDTSTATAGTPPFSGGQAPPGGGYGFGHDRDGRMPPGFGSPITGATLDKLKAVVTAKYPGTIERAMRLPDGSYVVHVIGANGEVHVHVTKDFKIDGTETGEPRGGMPPGAMPGQAAPSGATSRS